MIKLRIFTLIILLTISAPAQQSTKPAPPQTGSPTKNATTNTAKKEDSKQTISGRILDDAGKPVAEASVVVVRAGSLSQSLNASPNVQISKLQRTAITDNDGKFKFDELLAGAYMLNATAPGYVLASEYQMESGKPRYYRAPDNLTLRMVKGGVITGTVTDQYGEPVVAMRVQATKVRDANGRAARGATFNENDFTREWKTDDRGIYRIYGMEPGVYVVAAGGKGFSSFFGLIEAASTTYFPSGTRDTATPLTLQAGQELNGIDIRFRDARGFAVSGKISKAADANAGIDGAFISLTSAATGNLEAWTIAGIFGRGRGGSNEEDRSFMLTGVPDGDYTLTAFAGEGKNAAGNMLVSSPRRVTVRGGDVTGVELLLYPLGSISGQFVLEPMKTADNKPACNGAPHTIAEAVIFARADAKGKDLRDDFPFNFSPMMLSFDSSPNEKGEFQLFIFDAGRYYLESSLPSEDWYIRAITHPDTNAKPAAKDGANQVKEGANQAKDAASNGVNVKLGEKIEGVRIVAAEGAAGIKGRVVAAKVGDALPANLHVSLVPAETESANDTVRYYEAEVQKDGTYAFRHLAPGRYFVYLREATEEERTEAFSRPLAWNAEVRAKLRKDAEALNQTLELQPCQRLTELLLTYPQAKKTEPKKAN